MSKMSPKKALKKRRKTKANRKRRNIEHNMGAPIWRLDVFIDGKWYTARRYRRQEQIDAHMADTEARRKAGEVIIPGRIIHLSTGKVVQEIKPSGEQPLAAKGPLDAKEEAAPLEPKKKKGVLGRFFGKKEAKARIGVDARQ
jgi:hypothetical protein